MSTIVPRAQSQFRPMKGSVPDVGDHRESRLSRMRLRILSDLHLEVAPWTFQPVGEDLVILAGDICDQSTIGKQRRDNLFAQIALVGLRALYVIGNHEGYQGQLSLSELVTRIRSEYPDHVTLLDRESLDVGGFRFLGCSLWTDFSLVDGLKWR